jgi:alkylation response protein AidB-like acyl-CoA dehydrogenase
MKHERRAGPTGDRESNLEEFRTELRAWLLENLTEEFRGRKFENPTAASGSDFERRRAWQRILHRGGWAGVHWPAEMGGRSATLLEHATYLSECALAGCPDPVNTIGLNMVGPTIIEHGTPDQLELLPGILNADDIWAQLYSEPEAGSDLGNIRTRAERTDDGWVVSGQKVWISWGPVADRGMLLARTGEPGLRGLSCFVVPLKQPGVTVHPIRSMSGRSHFSEVFLDSVEIPVDSLLGNVNHGWQVAMTTLANERTTAMLSRHASTISFARSILELSARPGVPPPLRDQAVDVFMQAKIFEWTGQRALAANISGTDSLAAMTQRLQWGLLNRRLFEIATNLRGASGMLADDPHDPDAAGWSELFLESRGWTIGGGTSEIQRNMLAEQGLGMPRQPR